MVTLQVETLFTSALYSQARNIIRDCAGDIPGNGFLFRQVSCVPACVGSPRTRAHFALWCVHAEQVISDTPLSE